MSQRQRSGRSSGAGRLAWSPGRSGTSSSVLYTAEAPGRVGAYHLHRHEGDTRLVYERWRDEHGGAVPVQHVTVGTYRTLAAAKTAAARHHAEVVGRQVAYYLESEGRWR